MNSCKCAVRSLITISVLLLYVARKCCTFFNNHYDHSKYQANCEVLFHSVDDACNSPKSCCSNPWPQAWNRRAMIANTYNVGASMPTCTRDPTPLHSSVTGKHTTVSPDPFLSFERGGNARLTVDHVDGVGSNYACFCPHSLFTSTVRVLLILRALHSYMYVGIACSLNCYVLCTLVQMS